MNKKQILTTTLAAIFIAAATIFTGCQKEKAKATGVRLCPTAVMISIDNNDFLTGEIMYSPLYLPKEPDWGMTWVSAHPNIATVEQSGSEDLGRGLITPKAVGETTITCRTNDGGFTASSTVIINPKEAAGDYATMIPRFYFGDTEVNEETVGSQNLVTVKYASKNRIRYSIDETTYRIPVTGGYMEFTLTANNVLADVTEVEGDIYKAVGKANINTGTSQSAVLHLEGTFTAGTLDLMITFEGLSEMDEVTLNFKGLGKYKIDCLYSL